MIKWPCKALLHLAQGTAHSMRIAGAFMLTPHLAPCTHDDNMKVATYLAVANQPRACLPLCLHLSIVASLSSTVVPPAVRLRCSIKLQRPRGSKAPHPRSSPCPGSAPHAPAGTSTRGLGPKAPTFAVHETRHSRHS